MPYCNHPGCEHCNPPPKPIPPDNRSDEEKAMDAIKKIIEPIDEWFYGNERLAKETADSLDRIIDLATKARNRIKEDWAI